MEATKKKKSYELNCLFALNDGHKVSGICDKIADWAKRTDSEIISLEKTDDEGKVSKGTFWVEKKYFAYPIKKNKAGFYLYVFFEADSSEIRDLSRMLKLDSCIMRFMLTDLDGVGRHLTPGAKELSQVKEVFSSDSANREKNSVEAPAVVESKEAEEPKKIEIEEEMKAEDKAEAVAEEKEAEEVKEAEETKLIEEEESAPMAEETKIEENIELEETEEDTAEVQKPTEEKLVEEVELSEAAEESLKPEKETIEIEKEEGLTEKVEEKLEEKKNKDKEEAKKKEAKKKKISLDDLDRRLDDILNEEIL